MKRSSIRPERSDRRPTSWRRSARWAVAGCLSALSSPLAPTLAADTATKSTYSIDYVVRISKQNPSVAEVRWELAGIDEIREIRLGTARGEFSDLRASGQLEIGPDGARWQPGAPYGHLTYRARIAHVRGQHQRYDSYSTADWIVTRARRIFPSIAVDYHARPGPLPKSRARLIFRLPAGWRSATIFEPAGDNAYRLEDVDATLCRPRGWFALGSIAVSQQEIADLMIRVALVPGSKLRAGALFELLGTTLPAMKRMLSPRAQTVLVVSAPDPMWHGGISGQASLFMHGDRPLRTPDKTSPYLHELFHVLQPYTPAPDADWIEEGLAEYYSLELQRRAGAIDAEAFTRALGYFRRFGLWNVPLTEQHDNAATNNSAPLVMYALDQRIQQATAGKHRLDDVVAALVKNTATVDTARFRATVAAVAGRTLAKFFERHVHQGIPPPCGADGP